MDFPTLMGSVGGWVFEVDVTRGCSVGKSSRMGTYPKYSDTLVRFI